MTESSNPESREPSFVRTLLGFNQYVVGITLLCYVTGFVITNLYLGSLGVVSFDVLRVKYILTGLLFAIFIGAIAFPLYGLLHILRSHQERSIVSLIGRAVIYSVQRYVAIFIGILVLGLLAGSASQPPIGIPQVSPTLPWSSWLSNAPLGLIKNTILWGSALLLATLVVVLILLAVIIVFNPKNRNGTQSSRKEILREAVGWITKPQNIGEVLLRLSTIFLFILAWNLMISLVGFIGSNEIVAASSSGTLRLAPGWDRFFVAALILYIPSAIYLLFITKTPGDSSNLDEPEKDPTRKYAAQLYLSAFIIGIVVPLYSLGIYPTLPQQMGGGRMVPVEVITSSEKLDQSFSVSIVDVYLLDRSSSRSLFLLVNKQKQSHLIMEIADSQIQSITYKSFP
jgi:hypothetical protein